MPKKITYRGNGKYQLAVATGYNEKGKQIVKNKTITANSDREAEHAYNAFASEVRKGEVIASGKYKLSAFATNWFEKHCKKHLAPKTQNTYKNHLERRIIPALGHIDMQKLRPEHIIDFMEELEHGERFDDRGKEISSQTARYCFRVLSSMLQCAVQWQIITSNPCKRVRPPTVEQKKSPSFDEAEVSRMLELLAREPLKYHVLVMLTVDSGLRLGELREDIDFKNSVISVNKSNQALHGKGIFTKSPKNLSSVREVTISETVLGLLKIYNHEQDYIRENLGDLWKEQGWVFTQWNGLPMYPTTPSKWFILSFT